MQQPRNHSKIHAVQLASLLGCALLGGSAAPLSAQEKIDNSAPQSLVPVHLWVAGRTLPLRVSPLTDTVETYVPLTALAATGAQFKLIDNGNRVHVTARSNREEDITLVQLNGTAMVPLSILAKVLDASIATSATDPDAKVTFHSSDTVYLLAHVTDARFENGWLRVRTSFPVPFHTRMLAEVKPVRGYVDCVGAELPESFRPAPLKDSERSVLRIRTGQNSPTIARIVVDLADGVALKPGDTPVGGLEMNVLTMVKPGAKLLGFAKSGTTGESGSANSVGQSAAGQSAKAVPPRPGTALGDQGDRNPGANGADQVGGDPGSTIQTDPAANGANPPGAKIAPARPLPPPPAEIRGLEVDTDSSSIIRFQLATSAKVKPIVRYTAGTTQMLVDIPNATLALPDGVDQDRALTHTLISGVRMETIQGTGAPSTRITLDTARILGYSLNILPGSLTLELRIPRNATGVLADKLIVVDAGHGGSATGATGGGVCEKNCTLAIALKLRAELESCGARVIMTRTSDADVTLTDRSRMGNEIGADLFISIHNDSNERANTASGTSTYFHNSDPSSRALATCVQQSVMATTGLPSRGVLSDTVMYQSGFAVLRGSSMPAVLCEVAYINNQTDRRKLIDPQFQHRVAKAMCDGLRNYVEGKPKRTVPAFARPMPSQTPMPTGSTDALSDAGS